MKGKQGFASMSRERQRQIASDGGKASHAKGTAHEWTKDEARAAGRKGGTVSRGGRGRIPIGLGSRGGLAPGQSARGGGD